MKSVSRAVPSRPGAWLLSHQVLLAAAGLLLAQVLLLLLYSVLLEQRARTQQIKEAARLLGAARLQCYGQVELQARQRCNHGLQQDAAAPLIVQVGSP